GGAGLRPCAQIAIAVASRPDQRRGQAQGQRAQANEHQQVAVSLDQLAGARVGQHPDAAVEERASAAAEQRTDPAVELHSIVASWITARRTRPYRPSRLLPTAPVETQLRLRGCAVGHQFDRTLTRNYAPGAGRSLILGAQKPPRRLVELSKVAQLDVVGQERGLEAV